MRGRWGLGGKKEGRGGEGKDEEMETQSGRAIPLTLEARRKVLHARVVEEEKAIVVDEVKVLAPLPNYLTL